MVLQGNMALVELRGWLIKQAIEGFERLVTAILLEVSNPRLDCSRPFSRVDARFGFDGQLRTIAMLFLDEFDFVFHAARFDDYAGARSGADLKEGLERWNCTPPVPGGPKTTSRE